MEREQTTIRLTSDLKEEIQKEADKRGYTLPEQTREPRFYPKDEMRIELNVETKELDEAIEKAKELVALLREANELQSSLSCRQN